MYQIVYHLVIFLIGECSINLYITLSAYYVLLTK